MTKQNLKVTEVRYGKGGEKNNIITAYVPPTIKSWNEVRYDAMLQDTIRAMTDEIKNNKKIILTGDFNGKEVKWDDYATEAGKNTWGSKLFKLVTDNLMAQWVHGKTRLRGDDQPSRLDLIFTKNVELDKGVSHDCPLGKSDDELLERKTLEVCQYRGKAYKVKRKNSTTADYVGLKTFFSGVDWTDMEY